MRTICGEHGLSQFADPVGLLTSEPAANAITHTGGTCVRARWRNGRLRCTMTDTDPAPTDESGRGLNLLGALAGDWGHIPLGDGYFGTRGKSVWFELAP